MTTTSIRLMARRWLHHVPVLNRVRCWLRDRSTLWLSHLLRRIVPSRFLWGPPKGFYSECQSLLDEEVSGRVLVESQPRPILPPNSLRGICGLRQDEFQPWPVFWTCRKQARLVGKSLVRLDAKKRLSLEGAFGPVAHEIDPAYRNIHLPKPVYLPGNWTSVIAQWCDQGFYHWMMDALPRLVMLPEFPSDTRVLVPPILAPYQRESLQWFGVDEGRFRVTTEKHLVVENFYFSSATSMCGCYNPFGVQFLRRSFLPRADKSYDSPRRFYLRRVNKFRPITNEPEVLEFFRSRGWDIVDTEELSLAEQIQLFSRAEMICAPHGAGLTNLIWCEPGCKVLELCASTFLNGVFEGLAQVVGVKHHYLVFEGDLGYRSSVDVAAVAEALEF
jgi:capsular polysaccharide biosynthesis protein